MINFFSRTRLNIDYHTNKKNYQFSSSHVKIVPEKIFRRSISLEQTVGTCWTIQTHLNELNGARPGTFHELSSLTLVRLMNSTTFSLGQKVERLFSYYFFFSRNTVVSIGTGSSA